MGIKSGEVINLNSYEQCNFNKTLTITDDIGEITLTSNRKSCDFRVFVKARNSDLKININNLILNSEDDIAINFAAGVEHDYKSSLVFSGINTISSNNIAMCITNNQTVEIKGEENGFLKISGGSGVPSVGSSIYTEGAGNIIFSGEGSVEIVAGNTDNRGTNEKTLGSGCGIGFYNESVDSVSSIKVLDNINLKIVGEDGIDTPSICEDKEAGKGGNGIKIKNNGFFEKKGYGLLEISGGNGGSLIGDYSAGICGNGGSAISFEKGKINIDNNAVLKAGNGGSIKNQYEFPMVKGGHGGDIISLLGDDLEDMSNIRIGNNIKVNLGNGGSSGSFIDGNNIKGFDGGNSGSLINSNNVAVKVELGNIDIKEAVGGLGGNKLNKENQGKNGIVQKQYLGGSIEFIEFVDERKNTESPQEDTEELYVYDSNIHDCEDEEVNNIDIENDENIYEDELTDESHIQEEYNTNLEENLEEDCELENYNKEEQYNNDLEDEENDLEEDDNTSIQEEYEELNIYIENDNSNEEFENSSVNNEDELENKNKEKKSIWKAIKSFFTLED